MALTRLRFTRVDIAAEELDQRLEGAFGLIEVDMVAGFGNRGEMCTGELAHERFRALGGEQAAFGPAQDENLCADLAGIRRRAGRNAEPAWIEFETPAAIFFPANRSFSDST